MKKVILLIMSFVFLIFLVSCMTQKENITTLKNNNKLPEQVVKEPEINNSIPSANELFEKDKIHVDMKETVVISNCVIKNGPGDKYKEIGNLKYGDTVLLNGSYNGWYLSKSDNTGGFWIDGKNIIDYNYNYDEWNFGILTAENVTLGQITLKKGNLVWILKKDSDKSYVRPVAIDISSGYSGWIKNSDFTTDKNGAYFNQALLKKEAKVYNEANEKSGLKVDFTDFSGDLVSIGRAEKDGWIYVSAGGGRSGWVKSTDIYMP